MAANRLQKLLAFDRQVKRDQGQSPVFLHRRDRRFALDCQHSGRTITTDTWLDHLQRVGQLTWDKPAQTSAKTDELKPWRRLLRGFALLGVVLGVITMTGLLYYDGEQRINLTLLLAFAALQCLLALATMAQSSLNLQPWKPVLRRLGIRRNDDPLRPLYPVLMARAAHIGGICFGVAGLATLMVMVVIQDLAFGWSTTLTASDSGFHQLVAGLSLPWAWIWPAAAPDLSLVEATRFFRADPDGASANPEVWGRWWPFVAMVWVSYVIVPRLVGLALAALQLHQRAERALTQHPGMMALNYRLETPTINTGNEHNDAGDLPAEDTRGRCQSLPDSQVMIVWAGFTISDIPDSLAAGHALTITAGGQHSLAEDQSTIDQCMPLLHDSAAPAVTLVTRAWEPPTGELADFIEQARQTWPEQTRVAILPLTADPNRPLGPQQLKQWLRFSERMDDDRLCVSQPDLQSPEFRGYGASGGYSAREQGDQS